MMDTVPLTPAVGEDGAKFLRGCKIKLHPTEKQARTMDLWRRRCMQLWNLLLELEQAAYSGANVRTQLEWRSLWAQIMEDSHAEAIRVAREGKMRKDGSFRKQPGEGKAPPPLDAAMLAKIRRENANTDSPVKAFLKYGERICQDEEAAAKAFPWQSEEEFELHGVLKAAFDAAFPGKTIYDPFDDEELHKSALRLADEYAEELKQRKRKKELNADGYRKLMSDLRESKRAVSKIFRGGESKLFIWEHELQKVMARLKQVPRTEWIGDLPSHCAQSVVKDLIKALQAMLRERKKRASGAGGRDTGFPKLKKTSRYAAGSVYFANTQLKVWHQRNEVARVKLPNGVGWMKCRMPKKIGAAHERGEAKLMGGRIWRRGDAWWLSCQWELPKPALLPATGQVAAIKLAAAIPVTVHARGRDGQWRMREYEMPPIEREALAAHREAGRAQARTLEARKARAKKREAYYKKRHAGKQERGIIIQPPGHARIRLSRGFYDHAAMLAKLEAQDADARDAWLHELSTKLVRKFDVIAVQPMEVAEMMKKPEPPEAKEDQTKPEWQGKRRSLKAARVMMRRAAIGRMQNMLKYKACDLRGPDAYEEIPAQHVTAGACSGCGTLHPEWKQARARGRTIMRCQERFPDGRVCGTVLPYTRNSARVISKELQRRLEARREGQGEAN